MHGGFHVAGRYPGRHVIFEQQTAWCPQAGRVLAGWPGAQRRPRSRTQNARARRAEFGLLLISLSGCVRIHAALAVSSDDLVSGELVIAALPVNKEDNGPSLTVPPELAEKVRTEPYTADGYVGQQVTLTGLRFADVTRARRVDLHCPAVPAVVPPLRRARHARRLDRPDQGAQGTRRRAGQDRVPGPGLAYQRRQHRRHDQLGAQARRGHRVQRDRAVLQRRRRSPGPSGWRWSAAARSPWPCSSCCSRCSPTAAASGWNGPRPGGRPTSRPTVTSPAPPGRREVEAGHHLLGRLRQVERVEVQARHALGEQPLATAPR